MYYNGTQNFVRLLETWCTQQISWRTFACCVRDGKINKSDNTIQEDSERGYILKVSLEYPELFDLHNEYPLVPQKIQVKESMLSSYHKKISK